MKVELIDVSPCKKKLAFEVENEALSQERDAVEKEFAKKAKIPGFRPGKVPRHVVKARFAREIEEELKERVVSESFRKAIDEKAVHPLHGPILEDYEQKEGEPLKFSVRFEVTPEIKIENYKGMNVQDKKVTVEEEEVEKIITSLRESFARYEVTERETAADGDYTTVRLEGTFLPAEENLPIVVGSEDNLPEFNKNILGMKKGEDREFDIEYPENYYAKDLASKKVHYRMTLKEIKVKVLPALDDHFAKDAYATYYAHDHEVHEAEGEKRGAVKGREERGEEKEEERGREKETEKREQREEIEGKEAGEKEGKEKEREEKEGGGKKVETLQELRALVRDLIFRRKNDEREIVLKNELLGQLIEANDFEIPEVMVDDQVNMRMEGIVREMFARGLNPAKADVNWKEIREKQLEPAKREVKAKLILRAVAVQETLEVPSTEVNERIRIDAAAHRTTYEEARKRLSAEDLEAIRNQILRERALDFLFSNANIKHSEG